MDKKNNLDTTIENKYFKKNNLSFFYNYFTVILMWASSLWISFFFSWKILLYVIWWLSFIIYILIYLKRNNSLITSVWIYKYSDIFMEIIKSILIKKKDINNLKSLWKQKKIYK